MNSAEVAAPGKSLRNTYYVLFAALILLVLAELAISLWGRRVDGQVFERQQMRYLSYLVADEFRQSSDDLTRMARLYVATGDPAIKKYYQDIVAIRDGRMARPKGYDKVYWDLVLALGRHAPSSQRTNSIDQLFQAVGLSDRELGFLRMAKANSDVLAKRELIAMNTSQGVYPDAMGRFTLRGQPDSKRAMRLLTDSDYNMAKARIMKPLRDFQIELDRRTRREVNEFKNDARLVARIEIGLAVGLVLLVVLAFVLLNRRIIEPVLELTTAATNFGRQGFCRRVESDHDDELGVLCRTLNQMSDSIEQQLDAQKTSEAKFRGLIEAAPDALIISDADGMIVLVNRQAELLFGYSREELIGQKVEMLVPESLREGHPDQRSSFHDNPQRRHMSVNRELNALRKDGSKVSVDITLSPIKNEDGSALVCSSVRDVTERHATERAITKQFTFQKAMLNTIPYPMFIKDADARFVGCNQAYIDAFGVTLEFLNGKTVLDLDYIPKEVCEKFHAEDVEVIRSGTRLSYELPIDYKDGTNHVTLYTVDGFHMPDGSPGGLIGLLVDITDRQQAQEEIEKQRHLFQAIIDNAGAFIYVKDPEGRYQFVNRHYEELLGLSAAEILGKKSSEIFDGTEAVNYEQGDEEVRKALNPIESETETEVDGQTRHFLSYKFPLLDDEGNLYATAGVSSDITDLKRTHAALALAKEEADSANEAKSAFLATMSHEIRTPMNAVINMTGLALETELNNKQRQYMSVVDSSARGLLALINDILDFSKIEAGRMDLEITSFDLRKLLEEIADAFRGRVLEKHIEFILHTDLEVPVILQGDSLRLRQVLINLVGNAFKFTSEGEVALRVELIEDRLPDDEDAGGEATLKISVRDSGVGIPSDQLGKLGESFTQADSSTARKFGGTGLGLAISKRLIEMMGGGLAIESEEGEGSVFGFVAKFGYSMGGQPADSKYPPGIAATKVLVVEDNPTSRELLENLFHSFGMPCTLVESAEAAWEKIQSEDFGLAVIDWMLPGADGISLAQQVREHPPTAELPMIMVSSFAGKEEEAIAEKVGVNVFVPKPITASMLFDGVLEALSEKERPAAEDSIPVGTDESEFAGKYVLVAEDNDANQFVITEILSRAGFQLDIANNGMEAVEKVKLRDYDAVLMDMQMPEMDGLEATRTIRENLDGRPLPIIALTANAMQSDLEACKNAGMNDYVAKPIDRKLLFQVLERWILKPELAESATDDTPGMVEEIVEETQADDAKVTETPEGETDTLEVVDEKVVEVADVAQEPVDDVEKVADSVEVRPVDTEVIAADSEAETELEPGSKSEVVAEEIPTITEEVVEGFVSADTESPVATPEEKRPAEVPEKPKTKPARKKRAQKKKKKKSDAQQDLFGDLDGLEDESGPIAVTLDDDGVPNLPGIDFRDAMNRLGLPVESIQKMVIGFAGSLTKAVADLQESLGAKEFEEARRHAHSIAGAAGNLSADALRRYAKTLELALKFGQGDFKRMLGDLEGEAARVMAGIQQYEALVSDTAETAPAKSTPASPAELRKLQTVFEELIDALNDGDLEAIAQVAGKLKQLPLPETIANEFDRLTELVDGFDYADAIELARAMQGRIE